MIYHVVYGVDDTRFTGIIESVTEFDMNEYEKRLLINGDKNNIDEIKSNLKTKGWFRKFSRVCETVYVDTEYDHTLVWMDPTKYDNSHYNYVMAGVKEFIRNKKISYILDETC